MTPALAKNCVDLRATLFIGDLTTKFSLSKVNFCQKKILDRLIEKEIKIDFEKEINLPPRNFISELFIEETSEKIFQLLKGNLPNSDLKTVVLVSPAIEKIQNSNILFKDLKKRNKLALFLVQEKIINILEFISISKRLEINPTDLFLWDIGHTHTVFTFYDGKKFHINESGLSPEHFKKMIIEGILEKNSKIINSPNPISDQMATKILLMANLYGKLNMPKNFIQKAKTSIVVGTGGVHNHGIMDPLKEPNRSYYNYADVFYLFNEYKDKTDQMLNTLFPETTVTNLLMVMAYMDILNIQKVRSINSNINDGISIYSTFWK